MATAHQIRDLITETTTGTVRPRVPREVREEVCPEPAQGLALIAPSGVRIEGLRLEQAAQLLRLLA
jgi:hypothetical protein